MDVKPLSEVKIDYDDGMGREEYLFYIPTRAAFDILPIGTSLSDMDDRTQKTGDWHGTGWYHANWYTDKGEDYILYLTRLDRHLLSLSAKARAFKEAAEEARLSLLEKSQAIQSENVLLTYLANNYKSQRAQVEA